MPSKLSCLLSLCALLLSPAAHAWGDEGHEIIGLIAAHYLSAPVRARVQAMLAQDDSGLTSDRSIASEATWADRYRDSDRHGSRVRYEHTWRWHFVDLEVGAAHPDLARACYGEPPLPAGTPASAGPARDCVVDKIAQFSHELADPATAAPERLRALQFLLHLIGDLHQPLHASDDHDAGGNRVRVQWDGQAPGSLHQYWDTVFVQGLGADPRAVAAELIAHITPADRQAWARGDAQRWAWQSYELARSIAYGWLPAPDARGHYRLSSRYAARAEQVVALQLSRAGVRLAAQLNRDLQ